MSAHRLYSVSFRPDIDRRSVGLAIGDAIAITAFIGIGLYHHHVHPFEFPMHTLRTVVPFIVGWFLVAPIVGIYGRRRSTDLFGISFRILLVWIGASILGAAIRATPIFPGGAPIDFVLVNVVFGALVILPWRLAIAIGWPENSA